MGTVVCKTFKMFQGTSKLLLVCLVLAFASDVNASKLRRKRDIFQLGKMIYCTHGRKEQIFPFKAIAKYNNYGCFCGVITGGQPKDNLDNCCKQHDDCYEEVFKKYNLKEYFIEMYMNGYDFECDYEAKNITCKLPEKEEDHDGGDDHNGCDDNAGGEDVDAGG